MAQLTKSTPDYWHVLDNKFYRSNVYEPEADSFLFLDAIDQDVELLCEKKPCFCVEIGVGSGVVITHLRTRLEEANGKDAVGNGSHFFAIDVNTIALEAAKETIMKNKTTQSFDMLQMDLLSGFRMRKNEDNQSLGVFDVILFNPPYVPTSQEELDDASTGINKIEAAWSGGPLGRVVVDRVLKALHELLVVGGVAYIVAIRENKPDDMIELVAEASAGAVRGEVAVSRYTGEHLCVIRFTRLK